MELSDFSRMTTTSLLPPPPNLISPPLPTIAPPMSIEFRQRGVGGLWEVTADFIKTWVSINLQSKSHWERAGGEGGVRDGNMKEKEEEELVLKENTENEEDWKEKNKAWEKNDILRPHFTARYWCYCMQILFDSFSYTNTYYFHFHYFVCTIS